MVEGAERVLIVDDDQVDRLAARRALHRGGFAAEILESTSAEDALGILRRSAIDCVLLDLRLPGQSGLEVIRAARAEHISVAFVMLCGAEDASTAVEAMKAGASDYHAKSALDPQRLALSVSQAIRLSRAEREAAAGRALAEKAQAFQRLLVAIVSHDLRGPLQTIGMGAELLRSKGFVSDDDRVRLAGRILSGAGRMERITRDLLDYTEAFVGGCLGIEPDRCDLSAIAESAVAELRIAHPTRTIELTTAGATSGRWDAGRLGQLLQNLVSNAVEHGATDGVVRVELESEQRADGGREAVLRVANHGPAIPAAVRGQIFEPFRRADGIRRGRGNLGLGLFIVRMIVEAHSGSVTFDSTDQLTRFVVRLPLPSPAA